MARGERRWRRIPAALVFVVGLASSLGAAPASSPRPAPTPRPAATATPATAAYSAYFNWYDNASPGMSVDNVHVVNPGAAAVTGSVRLGATTLSFSLGPGAETYVAFPAATIGGPVEVDSTAPVNAAQRVRYFRSFSEVGALPATSGVTEGWWPWYDNASPGTIGDNVHLLNPDAALTANATLTLGSATVTVSVGPGQERWASFPAGSMGGPVHLVADHPVIAAQRVQTKTSFNELPVLATADAGTALFSNWYDNTSPGFTADNIHFVNVAATDAHVTLSLAGTGYGTFTVGAHAETHLAFPAGTIGGPVKLASDQPVVATQRVNYYDAFQEVAFHPSTAAVTEAWFNWYDDASPCFLGDNVHLTNPTGATVTGTLSMPGQTALSYSLSPGQETILNWRNAIGGPVHLTASTGGVIADKRVVICPPPPPPPPPVTHKIVVSLSLQHLWAYDNGHLLLETDVTTGRPELPTPAGTYHIFYKTSPYEMISPWPYGSPYWYPDAWVNWVLEFIQGGYFLHDAPWRSWFGPGSQYGDGTHGCVNIPNGPMLQLYNWANLGDEVDVVN